MRKMSFNNDSTLQFTNIAFCYSDLLSINKRTLCFNRPISDVTSGHVTYRTGGQACKQIARVSAKRVENIVDSVALW